MTRCQVYQALADGKPMQVKESTGWVDATDRGVACHVAANVTGIFDWIRVKPSFKRVPLGPEDVPPGSAFRWEDWERSDGRSSWAAICYVDLRGLEACFGNIYPVRIEWEKAMNDYGQISRDGGKTWTQCWKEEPCDS